MSEFSREEEQEEKMSGSEREDEEGGGGVDNEYYCFLNVSRTAEPVEVTAAYKRLARLYHPDKHQDPERRQEAELMFAKLKRSYEVLSDPHKRAIYDCLGKAGLEEQGWAVVQRTKTPREIREEYEALARVREERRLQQRTNPTSRFQMTVNATDLFDRYLYDSEYDDLIDSDLPHFEISELSLAQSIQAPLTSTDTATLAGSLTSSNGTGRGNFTCGIRRLTSDSAWQEVDIELGNGLGLGSKLYRKLGNRTFFNLSGGLQFARNGLRPSFTASLGNHLDKHTVGYLTYSSHLRMTETEDSLSLAQEQSGMNTMIVRDTPRYHAVASLQLGIPYTYAMLSYTRKMPEKKKKFRTAIKAGTFGAILEYGVEEKITENSTLGATVVVGFPVGVTVRVKLTRASQSYIFPFHLSDEVILQPIFYGTVTPLLAWFAMKKLVLDPYNSRKKEAERARRREANREKVAEAKREAMASANLMAERFTRIKSAEEEKGGLVIVSAFYGLLASDKDKEQVRPELESWEKQLHHETASQGGDESSYIDVSLALQCNVEDSKLILWEGSKSGLPGVWDPCPGEEKQILVRYLFQNVRHQLFCPENDAIKLPKNVHRLSSTNSV